MLDLAPIVDAIQREHGNISRQRSLLVGVSGIDGSGKGFVAERLIEALRRNRLKAVSLNVDGWLELPGQRFDPRRPAEHFYERGLRLDEMFAGLVLPLKEHRSIHVLAELADATNSVEFRLHNYDFADVDVIVLEGIFLFKRAYRAHFDLAYWVDCTFETALERALNRGQERLPPGDTIRDYRTFYFPAQHLHFAVDAPREAVDGIIVNDHRLHGQV